MKLISPKEARAIALKNELRIIKKQIKKSAKCGDASIIFNWVLFPEVISMLEEAGYVVEATYRETCVYWGGEEE